MAWQIRELSVGEGTWYRLHVGGLNTEAVPEQSFRWAVPSIADDRYVLDPEADDETRALFAEERLRHPVGGAS